MPDEYDVVVIGAGPTGGNAAVRAVRVGLTAAIVESEPVGVNARTGPHPEPAYWTAATAD